jgi:hypothetical protein
VRRIVLLAVALIAVAAAPGTAPAAGAAALSTRPARLAIAALVRTTYPGVTFGNVACPSPAPKGKGATFTCTVQLPGAFLVVDATARDAHGHVALSTPQAVIAKQALEDFVNANASLPGTVDCGAAPWHALRTAQKVTCEAMLADGTVRHVELTALDADGNVGITAVS